MFSSCFSEKDREKIISASKKTRYMVINELHKRRESAQNELPKALDIQRRKLIIATNQTPNDAFEEFSEDDELSVIFIAKYLQEQVESFSFSETWDDNKATALVKATLIKHHSFHLINYIRCARIICEAFSKEPNYSHSNSVLNNAIEYVLAHARQFGDLTKPIFQNNIQVANNQGDTTSVGSLVTTGQQTFSQLPLKLSVTERVEQLIKALELANNENKFMVLNAHITAFTLVILRRFKKQQKINKHIDYLIIEAYLNTDDARTKKNLHNSCIKYMEWHDMHLPYLFQKVLDLYDIDASVLWDHLNELRNREVTLSLIDYAMVYYKNYKVSKADPPKSQRWFPYCSCINTMSLSDKQNIKICTILNYLVEMKHERKIRITTSTCITEWDLKWAESSARDIYWDIYK